MPDRLILAVLVTAGASGAGGEPVERADTCRVHGPSQLASRGDDGSGDYVPHYTGGCRDGVAHGQGRLEWRMRWTPGRNHAVWEGRFVDGVFVGTQAVEHVVALPGDRYLVLLADDGDRRVWLVSRSGQRDPMSVCDIDRVVLDAAPGHDDAAHATDDTGLQARMVDAARRVRARCPQAEDLFVEIYAHPFRLGPNDNWPTDAIATATVSGLARDEPRVTGYRNPASARAQQRARASEREAALVAWRERAVAFATTHGLAAWLDSDTLDRNPYAWQGRRVGLLLRLQRMLDAQTALATQVGDDMAPALVVAGVTPDTFGAAGAVLAVDVDAERAPIDGYAQPRARVRLVAAAPCDAATCAQWQVGIRHAAGTPDTRRAPISS